MSAPFFGYNSEDISGEVYIIFGSKVRDAEKFDVSSIDGQNGVVLKGGSVTGRSGSSINDFNGDGISDVLINSSDGKSYLVFGRSIGFDTTINLEQLDGSNGFVINVRANSVSNAGDVNADGIYDIILGSPLSSVGGTPYVGQSYVLFGKTLGFSANLDVTTDLDGTNGFVINGVSQDDRAGGLVTFARDLNGDGIDDFAVRAKGASPNGERAAGTLYIIFGSTNGLSSSFDLSTLDSSNGFLINGASAAASVGASVSNLGDINDDGIDDLFFSVVPAVVSPTGAGYVIFGSSIGFASALNLSEIDGSNRFKIEGQEPSSGFGRSASGIGDGEGISKSLLIVGAPNANVNGGSFFGKSYVLFGD